MAELELEESDVIFRDSIEEDAYSGFISRPKESSRSKKNVKRQKMKANAVPINIPENMSRSSWLRYVDSEFDGNEDGELVPPHVIVQRRVDGHMMAFSVCSGNGRTLKGRDLSEVRNSILRMTGFLET